MSGPGTDRERDLRLRSSPWAFCRKCLRAAPRGEWVPLMTGVIWHSGYWPRRCPYSGCDGRLSDALPWGTVVRGRPDLPDEPERGHIYEVRIVICR